MNVPKARKLASGTWFIQLRLGGESIPVSGATEKAVAREAMRIKAEYRAGAREERAKPAFAGLTIGEAMEKYIDDRENLLSPVTVRGYDIIRKRWGFVGDRPLETTSQDDWQGFVNILAKKYNPKTLDNTLSFARSALAQVGYEIPKIQIPKIAEGETPFLTSEEIPPFEKEISKTEFAVPALFLLSSMRSSELKGLDWQDVPKNPELVRVKTVLVPNRYNKLVRKESAKNPTSTRNVAILIPELKECIERDRKASGPVKWMSDKSLRNAVARACKRAGVTVVGLHGLRHSFASLALHVKMPEEIAMELGGWKDLATMRKIYTHIAQYDVERYKGEMAEFYENANKNANHEK